MPSHPQIAALKGVDIAFHDIAPQAEKIGIILLLHGFASTARVNWINTGWTGALADAGYRVIALDHRGHGESSKFYTPEDYGPDILAADAIQLLDHLDIPVCDIMGYSMGARITAWLCSTNPERVRKAVFGGMGAHIFDRRGRYGVIAEALEAEDPDGVESEEARRFRAFADRTGSDRLALAACIKPSKQQITTELVGRIMSPTLIAVGTEDEIAGSPHELAAMMNNATAFDIQGLDHMRATGAESYKKRTLEFLKEE